MAEPLYPAAAVVGSEATPVVIACGIDASHDPEA
jgi:hypothetical protein